MMIIETERVIYIDLKHIIAERLKARRVMMRLTQAELANAIGIPATSISHFESITGTRKPSLENLVKLAYYLRVTTDYLLGKGFTNDFN